MTSTRPVFTILEVAEQLSLSRRTIYNLIRAREIPAVKIGGSIRIPVDALARRLAVVYGPGDHEPAA